MKQPPYGSGLHFVLCTPSHPLDKKDHRFVRSHAKKASKRRWSPRTIESTLWPHHQLKIFHPPTAGTQVPAPFGSYLSGLRVPAGFQISLIQDILKLVEADIDGMYLHEVVFHTHPVERGWFPYMISDECCLHSLLFSTGVLETTISQAGISQRACFHYSQTLRLLQARLNDPKQAHATSDATIMVVLFLASMAHVANEHTTAAIHIKGMEKMLRLRGGLQSLGSHHNMQVKVCRADLSHAIFSGNRPLLSPNQLSKSCLGADSQAVNCQHHNYHTEYWTFLRTSISPDLRSAMNDLHAFSCMINIASQASRKMQPETYNDIMISVLYRLTSLDFDCDYMQEAIRLGMVCYCTTIFMQYRRVKHQYRRLFYDFNVNLQNLRSRDGRQIPAPLALWLAMLPDVAPRDEIVMPKWRYEWLGEVLLLSRIGTWMEAREMLGTVAWVGFMHDKAGERVFDSIDTVVRM